MSKRALWAVSGVAVLAAVVYVVAGRGSSSNATTTAEQTERLRAKAPGAGALVAPPLPEPVAVSGTVTQRNGGAPIEGALVQLEPRRGGDVDRAPDAMTARTAADGSWQIAGVPIGTYSLSATALAFLPAVRDAVDVGSGGESGVDLALAPGGNKLTGVVSDVSGGPVSGAVVRLVPVHGILSVRGEHGFAALTDDEGRYELSVGDGRYSATARHADYVPATKRLELRGGEIGVDFSVAPGGVVEGTVVSAATSAPVSGALVAYVRERIVTMPGMGAMSVGGIGGAVRADDRGAFRIRGLETGAIKLTARAPGKASAEPTTVALGIAEQQTGVTLYVADAMSISGRVVVADDGEPAAGVTVVALSPREGTGVGAPSPTTADGRFVIDGLAPGRYRLVATSEDYVASPLGTSVTVAAASVTDAEVTVSRGVYVSGRVEPPTVADVGIQLGGGPGGTPGPGAMMALTRGDSGTRSNDDGTFEIGPMKPGDVTLVGKAADGRKGTADVDVTSAGADGVIIALESKSSLTGHVVDAAGKPVADARVSLRKAGGNKRVMMIVNGTDLTAEQSPTHDDGAFAIRGLDAGAYRLSVEDPQGQTLAWAKPVRKAEPTASLPLDLGDAEQRSMTLRVEARTGVIAGVVRGPNGSPAADVWVTATPQSPAFRFGGPASGDRDAPPAGATEGEPEGSVEVSTMMIVSDDSGGGLGIGGSVPPVLSDDRGRFEIRGLRTGTYDLMAEGLRGSARGFLPGAETGDKVTVDLVSLTRIDGSVTLGGRPVTSYAVELSGASMRQKQVRDAEGAFAIYRVDPGEYTVRVVSPEGTGQASVTVEVGKSATVAIDLETLVDVRGVVVDEAGKAITGAMVMIGAGGRGEVSIAMAAGEEPARTGADGAFATKAGPGQHVLIVMGDADPSPIAIQSFAVDGDAPVDLGTLTTLQRPPE